MERHRGFADKRGGRAKNNPAAEESDAMGVASRNEDANETKRHPNGELNQRSYDGWNDEDSRVFENRFPSSDAHDKTR